jgi:zinc transport system ATP-binding protein
MLLEVKNLNVTLNKEKIVENLSFQVAAGEILTILGPNGAGKSVLLKTLLGFLPYEGKIIWHQKIKIGYLPQGLNQLRVKDFPLTIQDFFALKDPIPSANEITEFLRLVGLEKDILAKTAGSLSGGQFQRILVAWVLISHPDVIFFDEPTTGVDIGGGETIYSLLQAIRKKEKLTIFLVTHDLHIVYKHSTNVLCLNRKGHNCFGAPHEMLNTETLEQIFGAEIKFYEHH